VARRRPDPLGEVTALPKALAVLRGRARAPGENKGWDRRGRYGKGGRG